LGAAGRGKTEAAALPALGALPLHPPHPAPSVRADPTECETPKLNLDATNH